MRRRRHTARRPALGHVRLARRTYGARSARLDDEPALFTVTTAGDARALIEWDPELVHAARESGVGVDPNGYIAAAQYLPFVDSLPDEVRQNTLARAEGGGPANRQRLAVDRRALCSRNRRPWRYDAVTVDCQHGMMGFDIAVAMLQAISTTPAIPLVRPARNEPGEIMRLLDAGAYGLICPMISTRAEAEALVSACRYPPLGTRSFGPHGGCFTEATTMQRMRMKKS